MEQSPAQQFLTFFRDYAETLNACDCNCGESGYAKLDNYLLMPRQAVYVFDWRTNSLPYKKGIHKLLGYTDNDFTPEVLASYIHPDDAVRYTKLIKLTNEWIRELKPEPFTVEVAIDYRIRHASGHYLKVMRQSTVFERCRNASPKSALNLITNLTGIKNETSVELAVTNLHTGEVILENKVRTDDVHQFSYRELEIMRMLKEGKTSETIAELLFISRHTVDTHRRNMLLKTGCKSTIELIHQATQLGIL